MRCGAKGMFTSGRFYYEACTVRSSVFGINFLGDFFLSSCLKRPAKELIADFTLI